MIRLRLYPISLLLLPLALAGASPAHTTPAPRPAPLALEATPSTEPPPVLLARTDDLRVACHAWLPPAQGRTLALLGHEAPFASPQAREEFDICMTALHPKQANAMVFGLMAGTVWGGIVTLVVLGGGLAMLLRRAIRLLHARQGRRISASL